MTFDNLGLHPKILKAVAESGYTEPTKIQSEAIPQIVEGFDIRASAQTGTGKTAAFLLPALHRLTTPPEGPYKGPRVLILAPTRELAMQIEVEAKKLSKTQHRVKTVCVVGGVPYPVQKRNMSRPYDILIATPGRLIDYINRKKINLSQVELLVLDEADRMLDMGFIEPVEEIAAATSPDRQTVMFSATMEGSVYKLSQRLLKDPKEVIVHSKKEKHENITQKLHYVDDLNHKNRILDHILQDEKTEYAIIFTSTKRHADQLVDELYDKGYSVDALHGDMNQRQRTRTVSLLKSGKIKIVVATDVAARGLDVKTLTHVINFDLPRNIEDYVHRIGRTGRAGAFGTAISFASGKDGFLVKKIEQFTGQPIEVSEIKGMEPRKKRSTGDQRPGRSRPGSRSGSSRFGSRSGSSRSGSSRSDSRSGSGGSGGGGRFGGPKRSSNSKFSQKRGSGGPKKAGSRS